MTDLAFRFQSARMPNFKLSAPRALFLAYAVLIAIGTVLLKLPVSLMTEISWIDAFFTATSAVTVTGLVVVDTGSQFSAFGDVVLLILIQLGGLGLMAFAVLIFTLLGIRVPMRHRLLLSEDLNQTNLGGLMQLVWLVFKLVFVIEFIGFVLLALRLVPYFGLATGLWHALFHSISAFNNAGFSLYVDSMTHWVGDPVINIVIPALFVVGGLGFFVLSDLYTKRQWQTLTVHSKLMLTGSLLLSLWGFFAIATLEWTNPQTLGSLDSTVDRLWAASFQSLTTRSGGFNTIDIAGMRDSSTLVVMTLMLIGGGPTSTAGGIKVTTFAVLILATIAFMRRRENVHAFGRSLPLDQIMKVLALTTLCLAFVVTGIFLVTLTNDQPIMDIAFEVISAFATCGLSRGTTGDLDTFGKLVIAANMFIGRVGPLTLGFLLATAVSPRVKYPSATIYLG